MKCINCGHIENSENNYFCSQCGQPLQPPSPTTPYPSTTKIIPSAPASTFSKTKPLLLGLGIGLLVTLVGITGFFFGFHSNFATTVAQVDTISMVSNESTSSESTIDSQEKSKSEESQIPSSPTVIVQVPQVQVPTSPAAIPLDPLVGIYSANYNMKVRSMPDYNASSVSRITQGSNFEVISTTSGTNYSIWGQLSDRNWICLQDADQIYCRKV